MVAMGTAIRPNDGRFQQVSFFAENKTTLYKSIIIIQYTL